MKKILVSFLIILLSLNIVFAEPVPKVPFFDSTCRNYDCYVNFILYWFGFPQTSSTVKFFDIDLKLEGRDAYYETQKGASGFLREIIIPLVALTLITFGFMYQLKIFGRGLDWINPVLSILMVIVSLQIGFFRLLVGLVFTVGPGYAFILWSILFFGGLFLIFKKSWARMGTETGVYETYKTEINSIKEQITDIKNKKQQILARMAAETDANKIEKLKDAYEKITDQEDKLHARIKDLESTYKG